MSTRRRLTLVLGLAAAAIGGAYLAAERSLIHAQDAKDAKEKAEPQSASRRAAYIEAFNKGDAKAVAAFWTEDAKYVDQVGREHKGRAAIEKLFTQTFAARKDAKLAIQVTSVKQLTPDVVLEDGFTEVTPAAGGAGTTAAFSAVLVKKDGEWFVQSIRDAIAQPPSNAEHFEGLEWLIGDWTGEAEKGESGRASYDWAENGNFIVSSFATTLDGEPIVGGTQWIGWDAVDKSIRSWSFYSGGGQGQAVWTNNGNAWTLETTARTADGRKVSSTNVVTKVDDDHLTWQMTKLVVDGADHPAPAAVKMKRVK
jgi:uncharacterized protein (TIGR02246 family)